MGFRMSREQRALAISFFLIQSIAAHATPVTRTTTDNVSSQFLNGSYTFSFAPIADASQLLSVSGGGISVSSEGGTFDLDVLVDYTDNTTATIFSAHPYNYYFSTFPSQLSNRSFAAGQINGVTFVVSNAHLGYNYPLLFSLPAGTVFTFDVTPPPVVPEPSSLALLGAAGFAASLAARRRRRDGAGSQGSTSE